MGEGGFVELWMVGFGGDSIWVRVGILNGYGEFEEVIDLRLNW